MEGHRNNRIFELEGTKKINSSNLFREKTGSLRAKMLGAPIY